jgi:rod shape-determining protein MreD
MNSLGLRLFLVALLALALTILPLPELILALRPPWVLILVLYLQFFLPDYFNIVILLLIGLVLDVLLSTMIGEHAFALSLVSWIASNKARRFRLYTISQQMVLVGFFSLLYQMLILMIDTSLGYHTRFMISLGSAVISILLWPWLRVLADEFLLVRVSH